MYYAAVLCHFLHDFQIILKCQPPVCLDYIARNVHSQATSKIPEVDLTNIWVKVHLTLSKLPCFSTPLLSLVPGKQIVNPHRVNCKSNAKLMSVTFVM